MAQKTNKNRMIKQSNLINISYIGHIHEECESYTPMLKEVHYLG